MTANRGWRSRPVFRVMATARPVRGRLLLAGLLGALAIGSSVGLLATSAFLISKASQQPPILYLSVAIVLVRAFGIGRGVFRYAERLTGHDAAFRSLTDLRLAVFDRLTVVAPAGTSAYRSGDLLNRLVADVDAVVDLYLRVALPYIVAIVVGIGSVLLVTIFVPAAALALAAALLVGALIVPALTLRRLDRSQRKVAPAMARLTAETVTLADGSAEVIALGQQQRFLDRIAAADQELTQAAAVAARSSGVGSALGVLAQGGAIVAAIVFGTQAVTSGALDGVNLALVILVPLAAYEAVQVLPAAIVTLLRVRESARRITAVLDAPNPVPDPVNPVSIDAPGAADLQVTALSAGWKIDDWVVGPVSLDVRPGRPVALVGPSGSGKSTVAAGLTRLCPSQGKVFFSDQDLSRATGDDVRRIIGLAEQNPHLFDSTVAENVRLARRSATDEEIHEILVELGLGPWLAALPDGLQTPVGRFGRAVSGGQRQRLALARVLLSETPIVVADEPTEYLDASSADVVMRALTRRCRHRGLLIITHRAADVAWCESSVSLGGQISV